MPSDATSAAPPPPRPTVFISYASADRVAARELRDHLEAAGLDVWLDEEELAGGEAWDTKIRNQIRTCTYFMPVISATTEVRREGYFRREWRLAVERTLDLADDVMFLVPVVIDGTRDAGARVPEKFFSVQWLRLPGGQPTPALHALAARLASGEAAALPPPGASAPPIGATRPPFAPRPPFAVREPALPGFPPFPPFPERGHRARFAYDLVLWAGHMLHALWARLPKWLRVIAMVLIVVKGIGWFFDARSAPAAGSVERSAPARSKESRQLGRPLAIVKFAGGGEGTVEFADGVFLHSVRLLKRDAEERVAIAPLPLVTGFADEDALARGAHLQSKFVLTGTAQRPAPGEPLTFTAKLYDVKQGSILWVETFDAAQSDPMETARRITAAVKKHITPEP